MSLLQDAKAAVTPLESKQDREEARNRIRDAASPGDWLSTLLEHHMMLERAFDDTRAASGTSRISNLKTLSILITGHAIAEEAAIYPAMAEIGEKSEATHAYSEQATVKMDMAELAKLDPASPDFIDKLDSIQDAVAHHMYEEEGTWFPELLKSAPAEDQRIMAAHYAEAFDRFVGESADLQPA